VFLTTPQTRLNPCFGFNKFGHKATTYQKYNARTTNIRMPTDTGSTSVHVGQNDTRILQRLQWQDIGVSKQYSRGLQAAATLEDISREVDRFHDGDINLGELLSALDDMS